MGQYVRYMGETKGDGVQWHVRKMRERKGVAVREYRNSLG